MEDNCEIVAKLPEMNNIGVLGGAPNTTTTLPASWRAAEFCHRESPLLTQFKALRRLHRPEGRRAGLGVVPQHPGQ